MEILKYLSLKVKANMRFVKLVYDRSNKKLEYLKQETENNEMLMEIYLN